MNSIWRHFLDILISINREQVKKPFSLYFSIIVSMGIAFITTTLITRFLGAYKYGEFKFITTTWVFLDLIISFGLYTSASRVLVLEQDARVMREIYWNIIFMTSAIGLLQFMLLYLIAEPLGALANSNIGHLLMVLSPLMIVYPLKGALTLILQGSNKIYSLGILNILSALLYLIFFYLLISLNLVSVTNALVAQQTSLLFVVLGIIVWSLKPRICNPFNHFGRIRKELITYGWPVYVGSLISVATSQATRMMIPMWVDMRALGYFSLALQFAEPLKMIPSVIATSSFREFSSANHISKKILFRTNIISLLGFIGLFLFISYPIDWLLGNEFAIVANMTRLAAIGAVLHGYGDLYNRFLGAHGKGRIIRNMTYAVGFVNVLSFILLTPYFKEWGAIFSTVLGSITYMGIMWLFYKREYGHNR